MDKSHSQELINLNFNTTNTHTTYTSSLVIKRYIYVRFSIFISLIVMIADVHSQSEFTQFFYENGQVSSEGYMQNEKPNGYWKTYFENGQLQSEGKRTNFELDSTWIFYNRDGERTSSINFNGGLKNGTSVTFKNDVIYEESFFENDVKNGITAIYYPSGELHKHVPFKNNLEVGEGFEYSRDGMIITLLYFDAGYLRRSEKINRHDKEGKRRGPWKTFHANGAVASEGYYMNDLKNGIFKTFDSKENLLSLEKYKDGELVVDSEQSIVLDIRNTYHSNGTIASSGGYVDGEKQGTHRVYDDEGTILRGEVYSSSIKTGEGIIDKSGDFEGPWKLYYTTGELKGEGSYIKSERDGAWVFYHKNGKIEHRGKYAAGLAQGDWTWYFEDGKLRRQEYYRRGKEDGESEEFNQEGNVISQGEFVGGYKEGEWFYNVGDHTERGYYLDGEKQGFWKHTYENGTTIFSGEFVSGLATGKHKWYYATGQLKMEGKYSSGVRVGVWDTFDEEGIQVLEIKYKNGEEFKINGRKVINSDIETDK